MRPRFALLVCVTPFVAFVYGCAAKFDPQISGFTCCNVHPTSGWISSNNVIGGPIIPAGEPARLDLFKRHYYLYGSIGDSGMGLRDDSSSGDADTLDWARKLIVPNDPRIEISTWPPEVRTAVQVGKVFVGMTRRQVLVSLGYPSRSDTPRLSEMTWRYWTTVDDDPADLQFSSDDKLLSISGGWRAVRVLSIER